MVLGSYWISEGANFRLFVFVNVSLDVVLKTLGVVLSSLVALSLHVESGSLEVLGIEFPHIPQDRFVNHISSHILSI